MHLIDALSSAYSTCYCTTLHNNSIYVEVERLGRTMLPRPSKDPRPSVSHCEFPKVLRHEPPSRAEAGANLLEALCKHDSEATSESRSYCESDRPTAKPTNSKDG